MKKVLLVLFICAALTAIAGCGPKQVERIDPGRTVDLSGKWNDTDSRLVSEEMIADALNRPWISRFKAEHVGKYPTVIVGTVSNRSHEHINVQTFVKDLERALINSGEVEFVASADERGELRTERVDQASHSSEETAKSEGEEIGADFMLKGSINTILDKIEGKQVMFYQVNLELIEIETHRKVWIGEKKIKKIISQHKYGL